MMALSLITRNCVKRQGLQSLFNRSPMAINNVAKFTQISSLNKLNLVQKCANQAPILLTVPRRFSHDHSFMWTVEKGVSASLLFVVPLGLAFPNFLFDNIMAILVAAHSHWGLEAVVIDYIRPIIFGPAIPKMALTAVYVISAATLGGLLLFNFSNIGIGKGIRRLWKGK